MMESNKKSLAVCEAYVHVVLDPVLKLCTARGDMKVHRMNYTCESSTRQNFGLMNLRGSFYESNTHAHTHTTFD